MQDLGISGKLVTTIIVIFVVACAILFFAGNMFYLFNQVQEGEFGVKLESGKVTEVVGPGVYSDFGWYVDLQTVRLSPVNFSVEDAEIITSDSQRLGVKISADAFRPNNPEKIRGLWGQWRGILTDDAALAARLTDFAQQAMKVCVGGKTFQQNVIGAGRDELRECIDKELSKLADGIGIEVANVVVPNVILSEAVQASLDAIVQSRLATEKAAQDALKAKAEAAAEQARQEGEVRVQQARTQEEAKQQATLAALEAEKVTAQKALVEAQAANELAKAKAQAAVIQAQKANELLTAQKDLEIAEAKLEAARVNAEAGKASEAVLAGIVQDNPAYADYLLAQQQAAAMDGVEKVLIVPQGTNPQVIIPGPTVPTLPVNQP